ncbi:hypothetical protein EMCRGX_G012566 [Ephydatia muelleri]
MLAECTKRIGLQAINPEHCKSLVGIGTDGARTNIAAAGCNGLNIYYHSKRCTETRYALVASVVTYSNHCPVHKCNVHWTGDPLTVSVNVVSLPNAPLDLYILMDLSDSMAAPLSTVKSISQLIVSSFTTNVRIGFGAFNDKPIYPYSPQTPAGCLPGRDAPDCSDRRAGTRQYSFLHLVNFTSSFSVPNVFVTTNLDLPESSFDALVQVLACEQELGWRNRSVDGTERGLQRVVLLITDNQPHLAGDGRLASIYQPNDGKCHVRPYNSSVGYLDTAPGILIYNEDSLLYDYPSVGLVASLLKKYDVIPIFGIVPITSSTLLINNTFLSSYQALQDLMTSVGTKAFARPISSSASDVLDVIKTVYQEVIQNIAITLPTRRDVEVSLTQITCPKLSYLACSTPTNLVLDAFKLFNNDIHHCFVDCTGFETSDKPWCQAQLGLNRGGLGLCLLFLHSSSTFIASFCSFGVYDFDGIHLTNALDHFNAHVPQSTNCPSFLRSPHLSVRSSFLQKWMTIPRFNLQMCG